MDKQTAPQGEPFPLPFFSQCELLYTFKTSMLTDDGDSIFKLLWTVSDPEIRFVRVNQSG